MLGGVVGAGVDGLATAIDGATGVGAAGVDVEMSSSASRVTTIDVTTSTAATAAPVAHIQRRAPPRRGGVGGVRSRTTAAEGGGKAGEAAATGAGAAAGAGAGAGAGAATPDDTASTNPAPAPACIIVLSRRWIDDTCSSTPPIATRTDDGRFFSLPSSESASTEVAARGVDPRAGPLSGATITRTRSSMIENAAAPVMSTLVVTPVMTSTTTPVAPRHGQVARHRLRRGPFAHYEEALAPRPRQQLMSDGGSSSASRRRSTRADRVHLVISFDRARPPPMSAARAARRRRSCSAGTLPLEAMPSSTPTSIPATRPRDRPDRAGVAGRNIVRPRHLDQAQRRDRCVARRQAEHALADDVEAPPLRSRRRAVSREARR